MGSSSPGVSTISTEFSRNFSGVKRIVCLIRLQRRLGWFAEVYLGNSSRLISRLCVESWICFAKTSQNSVFLKSAVSSDSAMIDFTSSHSCLFQKHTCAQGVLAYFRSVKLAVSGIVELPRISCPNSAFKSVLLPALSTPVIPIEKC